MRHILSILFLTLLVNSYAFAQCPANAGPDQTVCASVAGSVPLSGNFGGKWSTSGGGFFDFDDSPNAKYFPNADDISNGSVTISYTNNSCPDTSASSAKTDQMIITFAPDPIIGAGPDQLSTGTNPVSLNGFASDIGTVVWTTSGSGAFSSSTSLNTSYTPSASDEASSLVILTMNFTSATCGTVLSDDVFLSIQAPIVAVAGAFLDSTFNEVGPTKGKKDLEISINSDETVDLATDLNGNVYVLGNADENNTFFVTKLNSRGEVDSSFGTFGMFQFVNSGVEDYTPYNLARQPDGRILIGGAVDSTKNFRKGFVIRLNSDGSLDNSFGGGIRKYKFSSFSLEFTEIKSLNDGRIIVAGSELGNGPIVARLRNNGDWDNTYNGSTGYYLETLPGAILTGMDIKYNTNEVVFSIDDFNQNYNVFIIKLKATGDREFTSNVLLQNGFNSGGVAFQPDGKILLGAQTDTNMIAYRFTHNGQLDTAFGDNGKAYSPHMYSSACNNIMIDGQGRVIITGVRDNSGYVAVRFKNNGEVDNTFASNGMYFDYQGMAFCNASILSPENKVLLGGYENGFATVLRLSNNQSWHLVGNQFVLPGTSEIYEVKVPSSWGYDYSWTYSGTGYYFIPNAEGKAVMIYFTDNATSGKLTCYGSMEGVIHIQKSMNINVNTVASQAKLLTRVQCSPEVTDCSNNYISHFKLNNLVNDSSSCQSTGYSDYTRIGWMDTLVAGGVYSVQIGTESLDPLKYAALWIDYNNDGFFDANNEFVATTEGTGSVLNFQNIIIQNVEGPKRLRVRCKPHPFVGSDACPTSGEVGETEDYLIIINAQDKLEAPQIITPNEDGKNDLFVIRGMNPVGENALTIFDRYGKTVYSTQHYQNNWDGKGENGEKVTPGTYYYYFQNEDNHIRGFVEVRY